VVVGSPLCCVCVYVCMSLSLCVLLMWLPCAQVLFVLVWTAIQAVIFFNTYVQYNFDPNYSNTRQVFGFGLAIVRACRREIER
jgi:hypothetical protein